MCKGTQGQIGCAKPGGYARRMLEAEAGASTCLGVDVRGQARQTQVGQEFDYGADKEDILPFI